MVSGVGFFTLLSIGLALLALEALFFTFIIMWFGIGFLLVAFLELIFPLGNLYIQVALASVVSLLFLILFRKKLLKKFSTPQKEIKDDFFNEAGVGEIKNSKVFYKGTFWELDDSVDSSLYSEGDKVKVLGVKGNQVILAH